MVQAIIFDCFGVIITDALQAIRDQHPDKTDDIADIIKQANRGYMSSHDASTQVAELLGMPYETYRAMLAEGEVKNQELLAYIKQLRKQYKIGMLSNIGRESLWRRFTDEELTEHFDEVVPSGEIGHAKPEPEAYKITAERLGVNPEACVFVDDREPFTNAAESVGMQGIVYTDLRTFKKDLETLLNTNN